MVCPSSNLSSKDMSIFSHTMTRQPDRQSSVAALCGCPLSARLELRARFMTVPPGVETPHLPCGHPSRRLHRACFNLVRRSDWDGATPKMLSGFFSTECAVCLSVRMCECMYTLYKYMYIFIHYVILCQS